MLNFVFTFIRMRVLSLLNFNDKILFHFFHIISFIRLKRIFYVDVIQLLLWFRFLKWIVRALWKTAGKIIDSYEVFRGTHLRNSTHLWNWIRCLLIIFCQFLGFIELLRLTNTFLVFNCFRSIIRQIGLYFIWIYTSLNKRYIGLVEAFLLSIMRVS
jgi:hypothetical protein